MNANQVYEKSIKILNDYCKQIGYNYDFMMENLNNIANGLVTNDKNMIFGTDKVLLYIVGMIYDSKCEILNNSKSTTRKNKKASTAALKRVLKDKSIGNRISLQKSWIDKDKYGHKQQVLTNGYQLIVLNEIDDSLPIKTEYDDYTTMDYKKVLDPTREKAVRKLEITYDDLLADVKLYIQKLKAEGVKKSERYQHPYIIDLGEPTRENDTRIGVNADYLKDMLEIFPECEIYFEQGNKAYINPIYFKSHNGEGILMPIRLKENK